MTSGQNQEPISPYGTFGPASSPTSDSLRTLAADPDLTIRAFAAGAIATKEGYALGKTKNSKEPNYPWAIGAYLVILIAALVIYFLPMATADHKNQALGFLLGQATLIAALIFNNKDKD
jgi:hydrogenase/urease accessory protein HupE